MNKALTLMLALALALSLTACGGQSSPSVPSVSSPSASASAELPPGPAAEDSSAAADAEDANPIDRFFADYSQSLETTADMAAAAGAEYSAWYAELKALVRDMEGETADAQDRADLETYLQNAVAQGDILIQMTYLAGAGADTPRVSRPAEAGTLAPVSGSAAAAGALRAAFFGLYHTRYQAEDGWTWRFDADAARARLQAAAQGGG